MAKGMYQAGMFDDIFGKQAVTSQQILAKGTSNLSSFGAMTGFGGAFGGMTGLGTDYLSLLGNKG
jgi:hypothetical protein